VFLVSPLVGHLLTSRTIQPLARMIRTTARLRPGELAQRVPIRGTGDELDSLAQTINGLLDRIADYLQKEHDFLANAAHDLRTPLAAIQSSVEVALSGARSEEEYRELLGLVIEQCSALQTLVNQLLLLAETDADRLRTDPEPVPLDQLAAQTAEMFAGVAEHFGVELVVGELPPVQVPGNRHHLRQVVSNLLDNAIKFTAARRETPAAANGAESTARPPVGKVFLDLSVDAAAGEVRLRVRDTGIGIHPDRLVADVYVLRVKAVAPLLLAICLIGAVGGGVLAWFGVQLVQSGNADAASKITLFGQQLETTSVGVACIFIGAVVMIVTIRRVLKTLDLLGKP